VQEIAHDVANILRQLLLCTPFRRNRACNSQQRAQPGIDWLVGAERDHYHRQAEAERVHHRARTAMRDHQVAKWKQQILGNVSFHVYVRRLLAELLGVAVTANGKDQVYRLIPQPFKYRREKVGPLVLDGTERGVDCGPLFQLTNPVGKRFVA
jgi:hypothetical protein